MPFTAIDPATGRRIRDYPEMSSGDYARAVAGCQNAFVAWRDTPMEERSRLVGSLAPILRKRREEFAELMTREMGKPVREARSEIEKCAMVCEHYAEHAPGYLAPQPV
ncbi:MAG: aldehyde dehydrogenase family protein, partial [Gammaproteobacteria bacterium]|nr:aldehyde dehydrogenase family protein [Gammaproteobacteria bacterium]